MSIAPEQIAALLAAYFWPFIRIGALVMIAPVISARVVPVRVRIAFAFALTLVIAPVIPAPPAIELLSPAGLLVTLQQLLIGFAMGFVLQMVFDAMVIAGQTAAMSMGLGFAFFIDSARGVSVPVLSQFLLIMSTLLYLALDGHLTLLRVLADSFYSLPIGTEGLGREGIWAVIGWGVGMFNGALQIALPAVAALLMVNLAFGVMSRAAPTLNLFAVGFPVTLTLGFFIMMWSLPNLQTALLALLEDAFALARALVGLG